MSGDTIRLGIVGCGSATQIMYVPVLRYVQRCAVTALCDPNPTALDEVRSLLRSDLDAYQGYDEFLRRAQVDAVIIATPVYLHREQVVKAARAGKHVLCEKPMARTLPECDEMIDACRAAGVTLMIGFMKRFDKSMRHVKALIEAGRLGILYHLLCDWRGGHSGPQPARPWRAALETWGGVYQDHASHTTDLSRWWLGEIKSVSGEMTILHSDWDVEDHGVGVYLHDSGARSVHLMGASNKGVSELYQLDGSRATLEIQYGPSWSFMSTDPFRMTLFEDGGRRSQDETQYNRGVLDVELATSGRYKREVEHFCECVLESRAPLVTGEDGRQAIEAINAVYLSAYLGEKIRLPLEIAPDLERIFRTLKDRSPRIT